ncbi:hypothetical protein OC71_10520 [Pseudomonas sp. W15Feb9B]|nr:hypothetical protein OC71_10520 [Pseudomonas sp. W15Feb9B]
MFLAEIDPVIRIDQEVAFGKPNDLSSVVFRSATFVARELAPAGMRSRPAFMNGAATRPSGSKLPRRR